MGLSILAQFLDQLAVCGRKLIVRGTSPAPGNTVTSAASNANHVCSSLRDAAPHVVRDIAENMILDAMQRM